MLSGQVHAHEVDTCVKHSAPKVPLNDATRRARVVLPIVIQVDDVTQRPVQLNGDDWSRVVIYVRWTEAKLELGRDHRQHFKRANQEPYQLPVCCEDKALIVERNFGHGAGDVKRDAALRNASPD